MATKNINKSESVIWIPPRGIGERAFASEASLLALIHDGNGQHYARLSLDALPNVRKATLVFDARDVTLMSVKLPKLSGAKLRQAIPNAIEENLLQDPSGCAIGLGPVVDSDGRRLISIIDAAWLDFVVGAVERRGIRVRSAIPAQLALPFEADKVSVACLGDGLAVRTGHFSGIGWTADEEMDFRTEALASAFSAVLVPPVMAAASAPGDQRAEPKLANEDDLDTDTSPDTADELAQSGLVESGLPPGLVATGISAYIESDDWRVPLQLVASRLRLPIEMHSLPVPDTGGLDLLVGRGRSGIARRVADIDWRAWRLPMGLAVACLAVFLIGLNLHWGKLSSERLALRGTLERTFKQDFPNNPIVDVVLQMEQQVARARAKAGQSGPEDFVPMVTRFAQALGPKSNNALTGMEYRDGKLRVTFRRSLVAARSVRTQLQKACEQLGLKLRFDPERKSSAMVTLL